MAQGGEDAAFDSDRAIIHIDVDAFYAQVEEISNPSLKEKPLGVTQKYLVVTCNYPARSRGVTKMMSIDRARSLCPELVLISGEDLTPYRQASKKILQIAKRFGVVEKLGMDEVIVDVTKESHRRMAENPRGLEWRGHIHLSTDKIHQDSAHRPMDLRVTISSQKTHPDGTSDKMLLDRDSPQYWKLLLAASNVAADLRQSLKAESGLRCSAGIACNRLLAKLCSGLHKPDDQTILPPPEAAGFVSSLRVRALPGVGSKMERGLKELGIDTVADLKQKVDLKTLKENFGEKAGSYLLEIAHGRDSTPVTERGPPKSVTVEDSFKTCQSLKAVEIVVGVLAPDLVSRLREEFDENGRWPKTLVVKWRMRSSGVNNRLSASSAFPTTFSSNADEKAQVKAVASLAGSLLSRNLVPPFNLTLINLGATSFHEKPPTSTHAPISQFFKPPENGVTSSQGGGSETQVGLSNRKPNEGGLTSLDCSVSSKYYKCIPEKILSKRKEREQWEREQGYDFSEKKRKQEVPMGGLGLGGLEEESIDECGETGASDSWAARILKQASGVRVEPMKINIDGWASRKRRSLDVQSWGKTTQVGLPRASVGMDKSDWNSQTVGGNRSDQGSLQKGSGESPKINLPMEKKHSKVAVVGNVSCDVSNNGSGCDVSNNGSGLKEAEEVSDRSKAGGDFPGALPSSNLSEASDLELARKLQDEENRNWRGGQGISKGRPSFGKTQNIAKQKRKGPMDAFVVRKKID
ncbi:hypothetical protein BSKO_10198 [Bryopsis sp. KO-2023]|nr:hypothetical protein BSKO_10198 [Bryopsis sp. KO-2023]